MVVLDPLRRITHSISRAQSSSQSSSGPPPIPSPQVRGKGPVPVPPTVATVISHPVTAPIMSSGSASASATIVTDTSAVSPIVSTTDIPRLS